MTKTEADTRFVFTPTVTKAERELSDEELALVEAMTASMVKEVNVTLTGTFRQGMISVEQRTIPLNGSGKGSETIEIFPPSVNVQVLTAAPAPCKFEFTVKINGRERGNGGVSPGGKHVHSFAFPLSDFGL